MKWFALMLSKNIFLTDKNENYELRNFFIIILLLILGTALLYYIIIPSAKFLYKFSFNLEYNKKVKSNLNDFFYNFKAETIKNYLFGNLVKSERSNFIGAWIGTFLVYFVVTYFLSIIFVWFFRINLSFFDAINPLILIFVVGVLIIGFIVSLFKNNNFKFNRPKYQRKDKFDKDVESRLSKLKDLLDRGVINRQEYEKQRERIISDL
jgi:glucan phosphoethanolaminetransferase (alkaline phosphatase superfamily)